MAEITGAAVLLARTMGTGPALVERFTGSSERLTDLELRAQLAGRWPHHHHHRAPALHGP
jgi:hypothetical protein